MQDIDNLILQNRLLTEEVKQRIDQLSAINVVTAAVSQSLDLDEALETALSAVLNIVEAEAGGISLIDEEAGEVVLRAQRGWKRDFVTTPMRIPLGKGMSGQVITNDTVMVDNDLDGTEELAVPSFHEEHFRSIVMAPMHARSKIIGILSIMSSKPNSFYDDIIKVLSAIADTVGVALDNARLYETSVEQEHRLNAVLQSTADGIIATDQNGRIRLVNHAAQTMLEVRPSEVIGMPLRAAPIQPRVRDSLLFALSSRAEESNKSFPVTLESGRAILVLASPIYVESQVDQTQATDGWVIVLQDVTHIREAEIARTQFIQAAAHDMRNPLGVTLSSLGMLKDAVDTTDPTTGEILRLAISGVHRLRDLIDDLLNLEELESGYGFSLTEINTLELLGEVSAQIKPLLEQKAIDYAADIEKDLPLLRADRRWITRALFNYLDNAAKYTPEGGRVKLRAFVNGPMLHFEVMDTGQGIPVEAQSRVFERFYRVRESKGIAGTGLGLAIVKSVAEAHGGNVYVRSIMQRGSTFGMALPLRPGQG